MASNAAEKPAPEPVRAFLLHATKYGGPLSQTAAVE
jgi:hypothetical protein